MKIIRNIAIVLVLLVVLFAFWLLARMRGPYQDYEIDFTLPDPAAAASPGQLEVGVAMRDISPDFANYDAWEDTNNNGKFDPGTDTYEDRNGNGRFDGVWIAGFDTNRPAKGKHDSQWVRAIAFRNNGVTVVMATIDSIGIYHNDYLDIRHTIDSSLGISHIMFSATHCHEVADTMKIWSFWKRIRGLDVPVWGYNEAYMANIKRLAKEAIEEAVNNLQPADMYCIAQPLEPQGFVEDTRQPEVMDNTMYLMRFTKPGTEQTIATFVNWGNHPETLGGDNSILTSDFPHFLREGLEKGVPEPSGVQGFGGMCLYFQGQIGGLMTQLHVEVPHRDGVRKFKEDTFEKAESLGYNLAIVAANALRSDRVWKNENPLVAVTARTAKAPMTGQYKWAIMLGLLHEGYFFGSRAKTEVNVIRIGGVTMLTIPGEIYPEIVEGGIQAKPGNDFGLDIPLEMPPLRTAMGNRMNFVVGLANDEIGYIIPKSQWDAEAPYVYNNKDQYGEENSPGPDVAFMLHQEAKALLDRMNQAFPPQAVDVASVGN
ncbi:MAG: hypothetical protein IT368_10775 [Candidatus Hydrogenedentes bacterium]|nr:hypothetical protein [Candidatus Hydrogenedentota bacterium]